MSSGAFVTRFYSSTDTGLVHPIRVQEETQALSVGGVANAPAAGPATNPISAQVSQGTRSLGLNARLVTFKFVTAPPAGYKVNSPISLPWFNPATFGAITKGTAVTYLGATGEVVGRRQEKAN